MIYLLSSLELSGVTPYVFLWLKELYSSAKESDNIPFTTNRAVVLWWRFRIIVMKKSVNPKYRMTSNRKSRETVSYALRKSSNKIARLLVGLRSSSCAADNWCASIIMTVLDICLPCTKPWWVSGIGTPTTFWTDEVKPWLRLYLLGLMSKIKCVNLGYDFIARLQQSNQSIIHGILKIPLLPKRYDQSLQRGSRWRSTLQYVVSYWDKCWC